MKQSQSIGIRSESAQSHMVSTVPVYDKHTTIGDVLEDLHKHSQEYASLNYIYCTDVRKKLAGVVSIKNVFSQKPSTKLLEVMDTDIASVRPSTDQEKVVHIAIEQNIKAVPVVDAEGTFLGIVPSDVILSILHKEESEDVLRSVGIHTVKTFKQGIIDMPPLAYFLTRFPWLIIGLLGGLVAAFIIGAYESTLRETLVLASFIPAVVYMADAVGAQTQTVFIRSIAIDKNLNFSRYAIRELVVSVGLGIFLGSMMYGVSVLWLGDAVVGTILALAFFFTIIVSAVVGIVLPYILNRLSVDPAIASGPLATVMRDIMNIMIFFSLASAVLAFRPQ